MQTFLCYFDHAKTAADLDTARLKQQRVEVVEILRSLRGDSDQYNNHPAVQMWEGYEPALVLYGLVVCYEWRVKRGHDDKVWHQLEEMCPTYWDPHRPLRNERYDPPPWYRDKWVIRSHRSNLMRKAPHYYADKYDGTPENMPYLWPVLDHKAPGGYYLKVSKPDLVRLEVAERELPPGVQLVGSFVTLPEETE